MAERPPQAAPSEAEPDPYAVLGVSPDAEDVVIRAAYRALMHKYTTPGRLPEDPVGDDSRTRAVQGAYELLKDPEIRRAYDQHRRDQAQAQAQAAAAAATATATATKAASLAAEPLVLKPAEPGRAARSRPRRRSAAPLMVGLVLVVALGAAALVLGRKSLPGVNEFASADSVAAQPQKPAALATAPGRPLPCYVDGHAIGTLPLKDCATRNGVATGQLEVGLNGPPAKAAAAQSASSSGPANTSPEPAGGPPPSERFAADGGLKDQASDVAPPASPPSAGPPLQPPDVDQSMATVRAFYEALGDDDGSRAASLVEPERRDKGPLSAQRMTRFYSSLRSPLHLTSIYPLDPSTIFVRYQFTTADGRICTGAANVATTRRTDQVLIRGIRAYSGC
ncbi:MAG TPA: J domain-containing protein [Caulobacteraceae bacterium]|nr:J domain-containing protein [Caulobacteraceae bacterium]